MKRHLLSLLLFTNVAQGEAGPWWQQDAGYANSGSFHSELNKGKEVGTGSIILQDNTNKFTEALGQQKKDPTESAPRMKADGTMETTADVIIRLSELKETLAPNPRNEVVADPKDKDNDPGRLGLDEKLVDAKILAKVGEDGEFAQMISIAVGGIAVALDCAGDKDCEAKENAKLDERYDIYTNNQQAFINSRTEYERGIRRLTRDYGKLEPKGPAGGGQSGMLASGSPGSSTNEAQKQAKIDKAVESMSDADKAFFEERNIDAADFAEKMLDGEFKSAAEMTAYFASASEGGTGKIGAGTRPESDVETTTERKPKEGFGIDEGPVLNIKNGSFISFGAKKKPNGATANGGGNGEGGDDSTLMNALAAFVGAQAKPKTSLAMEGDGVTERDRRALLDFAVKWWRSKDAPAPAIPEGARQRTIFDMAHDTYGTFRGQRALSRGPVAFNER